MQNQPPDASTLNREEDIRQVGVWEYFAGMMVVLVEVTNGHGLCLRQNLRQIEWVGWGEGDELKHLAMDGR